jgi:hypothetical protein
VNTRTHAISTPNLPDIPAEATEDDQDDAADTEEDILDNETHPRAADMHNEEVIVRPTIAQNKLTQPRLFH